MAVNVRALLTRKIGPLPTWAWVGAGIGGLVVSRVLLARRGTAAGEPPAATFDDLGEAIPIESVVFADIPGRDVFPEELPPGDEARFIITDPFREPIASPAPGFDLVPTPAVEQGCTKATLPARLGLYPDAPNRYCPHGWHRATSGPCAGKCVPSTLAGILG